jgi:hypothetical protein
MAVETRPDTDTNLALGPGPARIVELAARPDAASWARECAWVPGTGYCHRNPCSAACVFNDQRVAEAERVVSDRRGRRPSQRPGAYRPEPTRAALLMLRRFLPRVFG